MVPLDASRDVSFIIYWEGFFSHLSEEGKQIRNLAIASIILYFDQATQFTIEFSKDRYYSRGPLESSPLTNISYQVTADKVQNLVIKANYLETCKTGSKIISSKEFQSEFQVQNMPESIHPGRTYCLKITTDNALNLSVHLL